MMNPEQFRHFPKLLLWSCWLLSGTLFSLCFPKEEGNYFWLLLLGLGGSLLYALLVLGWNNPQIWHDGRLKLFAMHPSRLALYCSLCLLFTIKTAISGKSRQRSLAFAGSLLLGYLLFKTNTRGNLLVLPLGLVCLGFSLPRHLWRRFALLLLVLAALGAGLLWSIRDSEPGKRLIGAVVNIRQESTFRSRIPIWHIAWDAFTDKALLGNGPRSYQKIYDKRMHENRREIEERFATPADRTAKHAHNIVLGRLVETGLPGTLAFFFFYIYALWSAWRGPEQRRWLLAPLVFYLGSNMLDDGLYRSNDAVLFFLAGSALWARQKISATSRL